MILLKRVVLSVGAEELPRDCLMQIHCKFHISFGQPRGDSFAVVQRETSDDVGVNVVHQVESRIEPLDCLDLFLGTGKQAKHLEPIQTMNDGYYLLRSR